MGAAQGERSTVRRRALLTAGLLIALDWMLMGWVPAVPYLGPFGLAVLVLGLTVWVMRRGDLGLEVRAPRADLAFVARILGACAVGLLAVALLGVLLLRSTDVELNLRTCCVHSTAELGPYLLLACVQAPLLEEVVHRAWIQRELRDGLGSRGAILVSGLVFWVHHWWVAGSVTPPNQLIGGWLIAWSFEWTRSLTAPILLHAAGNLSLAALDMVLLTWPEQAQRLVSG